MELGLLYEFDVPRPWAGEHPWGQRTAERGASGAAAGLRQGIKSAEQSITTKNWSRTPPAPELAQA